MLTAVFSISALDDLRRLAATAGQEPTGQLVTGAGFSIGYLLTILAVVWRSRWVLPPFALTLVSALFLDEQVTALLFVGIVLALAAYTVRALPMTVMVVAALGWELGWRMLHDVLDERLFWSIPFVLLLILPGHAIRILNARRRRERARAAAREDAARRREAALVAEHRRQRLAVSRELHDVVAHELTRIAMHANVAQLSDNPEGQRDALQAISASARDGMTEMRRLVRLLNADNGIEHRAADAPGPGIGGTDLTGELDRATNYLTELGFQADQTLTGDPARIPPGLLPTAVMVLREATTNIAKHAAPGAQCTLTIDITDRLIIEVSNEVSDRTAENVEPGLGLPGLRGRIIDLDGTLTTGRHGKRWGLQAIMFLTEQIQDNN